MVLSHLHAHSYSYSAMTPPKTPLTLRSSLWVSLRVCTVVFFPGSEFREL